VTDKKEKIIREFVLTWQEDYNHFCRLFLASFSIQWRPFGGVFY